MEVCTELLLGIEHHKRFLCHGSMETFLHRGSVEACTELVGCIEYHKRFLRRGSVEDCTEQVRVH